MRARNWALHLAAVAAAAGPCCLHMDYYCSSAETEEAAVTASLGLWRHAGEQGDEEEENGLAEARTTPSA